MAESIDINLNNGTMWLRVSCGEVVSQQKWSETSVYSHGGSVSADGRHVSAPSISSSVTEKHEFWIREAGGKEVAIEFSGGSFQARAGHKVWVAWGSGKGFQTGPYLFAHNFVTGKTTEVKNEWRNWLYAVGLIKKPLLYRVLTGWMPLFFGFIAVIFSLNTLDNKLSISEAVRNYHLSLSVADVYNMFFRHVHDIGDVFPVLCLFLAGWISAWCVTNLVGYLFFLQWRDKVLVKSVKKKILNACIEAANKANVTN